MTDNLPNEGLVPAAATEPPLSGRPPAAPGPTYPVLVDAWPGSRPFALDGVLERNGFTPVWTALLALVGAWILFQVVANAGVAVALVMQHMQSGATDPPSAEALLALIGENGGLLLGWNAVGQLVGFGLLTWLLARMTTSAPGAFLRFRSPGADALGLAALGWVGIYPVVLWLGELSTKLPLPEWVQAMDQMRTDLIESLLLGGDLSTAYLFVTIAIVPSLFEEVLFRGYLQRQFERRLSLPASLIGIGFLFGAYHMSVTQLLPLSVLGVYLCFVVWVTGSIWTGVWVHLLNNGLAVIVSGMARDNPALNIESAESLGLPWYSVLMLVTLGSLTVVSVGRILLARRTVQTQGAPDGAPVTVPPALPQP